MPQYSDNFEFSGSTRNKSHFSELIFFNIFHQDVKFGIFDGKNVMSKFARIFETYSAIIIFRENAFPKTCDWIFLELFRCDARYLGNHLSTYCK